MKYRRHIFRLCPTKVTNIPNRTSIRERPLEADGTRFGDWEMDLIVGKEGKGAILTLTERSSNLLLMEKLPDGKKAASLPRVVNRLLFPYRGKGVTVGAILRTMSAGTYSTTLVTAVRSCAGAPSAPAGTRRR